MTEDDLPEYYCYRSWNESMFCCYFRQGCNCVKKKKKPNYAVGAIAIPYGFNFKVFLSEDLIGQSVSSCFLKMNLFF